jgi:hypothetical protein
MDVTFNLPARTCVVIMKVSQVEEEVALHTVDGILVHSSVEGLGLGNFCLRVGEYYSPPAFKNS